ncbi:hypothetical protein ABW20_dc0106603 [Dactylellina cionopaga]|nr:hypothetical protein ABW20_dc0106603 [Dactylellina cionopaga]
MKFTLALAVFAAFAAAAPQNDIYSLTKREKSNVPQTSQADAKRCGGGSTAKCASGETCIAEYGFLDDPKGICVKKVIECGATRASPDTTCPKDKNYHCIPRKDLDECPQDVAYCGYCVEEVLTDKVGVRWNGNPRCGGSSGKKCFENPNQSELCAGDSVLKDGGVCLAGYTRSCKTDSDCSFKRIATTDICVSACPPSDPGCTGKVCLAQKYIDEFGLKKATTTAKTSTTTSKPKYTITTTTVKAKTTTTTKTMIKTTTTTTRKPKPSPNGDGGY